MEEKDVYKECYTEINKVNHRLAKLATIQAIAFSVALVLIIGLMAGFYFFSDYGYGIETAVQYQSDGTQQTQTLIGGGDKNG